MASEDRTFYENAGISPTGMARALVNNLRGGATQGGSTITQQYAERYYAGQTTTDYVGKAKETLLAVKIAQSEDKQQVLGNYLNTIYLGRGTYGIQAAAEAYFGVNAADLTISQAALIAGIIPSPSNWDPLVEPRARRAAVEPRAGPHGRGRLDHRATSVPRRCFPETIPLRTGDTYAGPQGYLLDMVRRELRDRASFTDEQIDTARPRRHHDDRAARAGRGRPAPRRRCWTALSPARSRRRTCARPSCPSTRSTAPSSPCTAAADFISQPFNAATQGLAQAGSTFKPFTLVAALENGLPLTTRFPGFSPMDIEDWNGPGVDGEVENFGGQDFGNIDLVRATEDSVNTVYAQLNMRVGPEKTAEVAQRAGVTTPVGTNPGNVLGTDAVHPIDMAASLRHVRGAGLCGRRRSSSAPRRTSPTTASPTRAPGPRSRCSRPTSSRTPPSR